MKCEKPNGTPAFAGVTAPWDTKNLNKDPCHARPACVGTGSGRASRFLFFQRGVRNSLHNCFLTGLELAVNWCILISKILSPCISVKEWAYKGGHCWIVTALLSARTRVLALCGAVDFSVYVKIQDFLLTKRPNFPGMAF